MCCSIIISGLPTACCLSVVSGLPTACCSNVVICCSLAVALPLDRFGRSDFFMKPRRLTEVYTLPLRSSAPKDGGRAARSTACLEQVSTDSASIETRVR